MAPWLDQSIILWPCRCRCRCRCPRLPGPHRKSITHSGKAVPAAFITHSGKAVPAAFITHCGKAAPAAFITHSCIRLLINARAALALRSGLYHICALSHGRNELLLAVSAASEPLAYLMVSAGAGAGAAAGATAGAAGRSAGRCQIGCPCSRAGGACLSRRGMDVALHWWTIRRGRI